MLVKRAVEAEMINDELKGYIGKINEEYKK
jgi:hypothetical protein